jgi:methyl-accepting chemotaxis protein
MDMFSKLTVRTRLGLALGVAVLGVLVLGVFAVLDLRAAMIGGHQDRIKDLVVSASGVVENYKKAEQSGALSHVQAQAQAKEVLRGLRFGKDDYFFIYDYDGKAVMVAGNPKLEGQVMLGKTDAAGFKLWDALVSTAKQGSGYVSYVFPRAGQTESKPKLAYVVGVPDWQWVLGTGVYVDDVNDTVMTHAIGYLLLGVLVLAVLGVVGGLAARSIVHQLGGEPAHLVNIMQRAANGDLRSDFATRGGAESVLGQLKAMLSGLGTLVREVYASASELSSKATLVAQSAQQFSDAAIGQSDATSSMAAGVEEMTVAVNHIADSAKHSEAESQHVNELGIAGEKRAVGAVEVISGIADTVASVGERISGLVKRTDEIGSIANVIKEIAAQTNLLALNAAIEAARAGEQGRGFAVVADEVRGLAERTAQATVQIEGMVGSIHKETHEAVEAMNSAMPQVQAGVSSSQAAADSLREIRQGAEESLGHIRDVADATREQSLASTSIAQQVERIARVFEETSRAVAGSSETAIDLEKLAKSLQVAVSHFQI